MKVRSIRIKIIVLCIFADSPVMIELIPLANDIEETLVMSNNDQLEIALLLTLLNQSAHVRNHQI